jgi:hypothetical protein
MSSTTMIEPIASMIAGLCILAMPHLLNYIVALYLLLTGIVGVLSALSPGLV